ncbi:MAG: Prevent-host-death protein [Pseudomonadota bacterium]|nr:Prevent-host-death protein [Pseudomonadota bacterium]
MSVQTIYAHKTIGITDLKRDGGIIDTITEPIAILKRDSIKAYLIPEKLMEVIADYLDDIKLAKLVNERIDKEWDKAVEVNIDDL